MAHQWTEKMKQSETVEMTKDAKLKQGTLIGFKAFGDEITAAYPVYTTAGNKIWFVLYFNSLGKAVLDGTVFIESDRMSDKIFVNKEPVIIDFKEAVQTTSFGQELQKAFL